MKLVVIYGPPAVGKLTVAQELQKIIVQLPEKYHSNIIQLQLNDHLIIIA